MGWGLESASEANICCLCFHDHTEKKTNLEIPFPCSLKGKNQRERDKD